MPEYAMWTLIISLFILSFSLYMERISLKKDIKNINEKLQERDKEFADIKKQQEEKIINLTNQVQECENKIADFEKEKKTRTSDAMNRPLNLVKCPI